MTKLKTALLLSYICIASASASIITPALPEIEKTYHLGTGAVEWLVSIFLLGYVLGQLIYGPLANAYGRVRALHYGLIINLVGVFICLIAAYTDHYYFLLLGRLVTALGAASGLSCTFMMINEMLSAEDAKHAMSFSIVSFTLGVGLAVTLGGIVTEYFGWIYCFWVLLIHGIIMLTLTRFFSETLKEPIALHPVRILKDFLHALKNPQLVVFSLTVGFMSVLSYGYSAAAPIFAQSQLQLSPSAYGYWNLCNMAGMLGSGFLGSTFIKNFGIKNVLKIGLYLLVPGLVSLSLLAIYDSSSTIWFFLTTTWLYLIGGLIFPTASYFASNAIEDKASASSMMSFLNMGSGMVGVIILGYLPFNAISAYAIVSCCFFLIIIALISPYLIKRSSLDYSHSAG